MVQFPDLLDLLFGPHYFADLSILTGATGRLGLAPLLIRGRSYALQAMAKRQTTN